MTDYLQPGFHRWPADKVSVFPVLSGSEKKDCGVWHEVVRAPLAINPYPLIDYAFIVKDLKKAEE